MFAFVFAPPFQEPLGFIIAYGGRANPSQAGNSRDAEDGFIIRNQVEIEEIT
jgi:hypothetical protein